MRNSIGVVALLVLFATSGCFHEEETVEPKVAQAAAVNQVIRVLDKTGTIFEQETSKSGAIDMIDLIGATGSGTGSSTSRVKSAATDGFNRISEHVERFLELTPMSKARNKVNSRMRNSSDNNLELNEEDISAMFELFFEEPTTSGSDIIYKLKASEICRDDYTGRINRDCVNAMNQISMIIRTSSAERGAVILAVTGQEILELGYSPTIVYLEVDLDALATAASTMERLYPEFGGNDSSIPDVFEGRLRVSAELISNNSAKVTFAIPQTINIESDDGDAFEFSIGSSDEVFAVEANNRTSTIKLSMGLASVYALYFNEFDSKYEIALDGLTGLLLVDNDSADQVTLRNIGIGNRPFTLSIDGTVAVEFDMKTFGATINGDNETIMLDSDFKLFAGFTNVNGELSDTFVLASDAYDRSLQGTIEVSVPSGTVMRSIDSSVTEDVTKIETGGPIEISGDGYFRFNESISEGECFVWEDDLSVFGDGFESGDCSQW